MMVKVISDFSSARGIVPAGSIINIQDHLLEKLKGKVEPYSLPANDWRPEPIAWLTESGELRTQGVFDDLAGEIIKLTASNLPLQAMLLLRHCERYSGPQWKHLVEDWNERAAIMEFDGKMDRATAEYEASKLYRVEAFLDELRSGP